MKSIKSIIICLFFTCSISSCNNQKYSIDYEKYITLVKCEFLRIDDLIGSPYDIVYRDSLLIYYDRHEGKFLSVFDLKNNHFVGRFLSEGNGPGEAIAPLYILPFPTKDELYIYQRNPAILSIFNIPELQISKNIQISSSGSWRPFEMQRTKDFFIGLGIFEIGRFAIYDSNGNIIKEGGHYPFKGEEMDKSEAFLSYQGPYCTNPDNNRFASGCLYSDYIAFYEVKDNEIITLKEYSAYDVNVIYNNNQIIPNNNCIINYTYAFATKSYCYMLFAGKTYEEKQNNTNGGNYIIVFDWDGNYIKTYETDHEIYNFYVDEINGFIYATAQEKSGEKGIAKIKI